MYVPTPSRTPVVYVASRHVRIEQHIGRLSSRTTVTEIVFEPNGTVDRQITRTGNLNPDSSITFTYSSACEFEANFSRHLVTSCVVSKDSHQDGESSNEPTML